MKLFNFLFFLIIFSIGHTRAQSEEKFNLTVKIPNIDHVKGEMLMAVYNKEEGYMDKKHAIKLTILPVKKKQVIYTYKNLKKGTYAIALMQDLDGNRKMDKNFMGIPKEPYGFSKNPKITFSAPSFEDCAVQLDKNKSIEIKL